MRRIGLLLWVAAVLAVLVVVAAPALATHRSDNGFIVVHEDNDDDHHSWWDNFFWHDDRDFDSGTVSFGLGDVENESGEIETENNFAIDGNNNNACLGQLQFGQTGNFTNQQGVLQYASDADDIEFAGPEVTFAPENETACEQEVQQAAAASSFWWPR